MPSEDRGTERPRAPLLESCLRGGVLRLIEVLYDDLLLEYYHISNPTSHHRFRP